MVCNWPIVQEIIWFLIDRKVYRIVFFGFRNISAILWLVNISIFMFGFSLILCFLFSTLLPGLKLLQTKLICWPIRIHPENKKSLKLALESRFFLFSIFSSDWKISFLAMFLNLRFSPVITILKTCILKRYSSVVFSVSGS